MNKYIKKSVALLIAVLLLGQSFSGEMLAAVGRQPGNEELSISSEQLFPKNSLQERLTEEVKTRQEEWEAEAGKEVRILVELEGEPVISEAIRRKKSLAELEPEVVEGAERRIWQEQNEVLSELREILPEAELPAAEAAESTPEMLRYSNGFNGLAMTVRAEDIPLIEKRPQVKRVYLAEEYERPQMKTSHGLIGSSYAWENAKYKGDGMVVAVIDTGIDYRHLAMTVDFPEKIKHSKESMQRLIEENRLKGKYFTDKVPYGYNYYDHNFNTLDSYGAMHGMHVAGTIGANAKNGGEINGVAPNVQLLALKVFSDDLQYPTTFTDVWLKAIDDAIALKADVINMSLGAPAGLASKPGIRPEDEALRRAAEAGIVVAVSAGNEGNILTGNYYKEKANPENPDTGVVASPSLSENAISVASADNEVRYSTKLYWQSGGQEKKAPINIRIAENDSEVVTGSAVDIGEGEEDDYEQVDVKDKIVLLAISNEKSDNSSAHEQGKGEALIASLAAVHTLPADEDHHPKKKTLLERVQIAESKNPRAILLYNDKQTGENLGISLKRSNLPFSKTIAVIGYSGITTLREDLKADANLILKLSSILETEASLTKGRISEFSSWGPTPDLRIKPELTAPGGNIYSTAEDDQYQSLSGTSMASPHVAGAAVLLKQHLQTKGIHGKKAAELVKLLLMNTAAPVVDADGRIDFVRKQGAGLIRLDKALQTEVMVTATGTNDKTADGKLELKELTQKEFEATLYLENKSSREKSYRLTALGIFEPVQDGKLRNTAENIENFGSLADILTVPANSGQSYSFRLNFSDQVQIRENSFVEGFLKLQDISGGESVPIDLSVPFLAYYGDWDSAKAIDAFAVKELGKEARNPQFMVNKESNVYSSLFMTKMGLNLSIRENVLYFSPDLKGERRLNFYPHAGIRIAPLRNISRLEYSILDAQTGETLKVLGEDQDIRKLNRLSRRSSYLYMPESFWDGSINGIQISDGKQYIYQIKATLNNRTEGEPAVQTYQYLIQSDTTAPVFSEKEGEKPEVIEDGGNLRKKLRFTVQDEGYGLDNVYLQSVFFVDPDTKKRPQNIDEITEPIDLEKWKIQYGKSLKIQFLSSEDAGKAILPPNQDEMLKVENGVLRIPEKHLPLNAAGNGEIYCDINGHENRKILIETYYDAVESHVCIIAGDFLGNTSESFVKVGVKDVYTLSFLNFFDNIRPYNGKITVNGQEVKDINALTQGKSEIRIHFPDKKMKLNFLKIGETILVKNGETKEDLVRKYELKITEEGCSFMMNETGGEHSVITVFEEHKEKVNLSFKDIDFSAFDSVKVITGEQLHQKTFEVSSASQVLAVDKGIVNIFIQAKNELQLQNICMIDKNDTAKYLLNCTDHKEDYYSEEDVYLQDQKNLYIKVKMSADARLKLIFTGDGSAGEDDFFGLYGKADKQKLKAEKDKYPVIFLESPEILEIRNEKNTGEEGILLSGFIGHVGTEGLQKVTVSLLDKNGNLLDNPVEIPIQKLEYKEITYKPKDKILYQGMGYGFSLPVKPKGFLTNIRIEALAGNGKSASIVRRSFFDKQFPALSYEIAPRRLSEALMTLKVKANDDSFKLMIYQNDSYLGGQDLSKLSLESSQASYEQSWKFPLKIGQNKIELKVVDAAGHESRRTIYVYRSKK